MCVYIHTHTHLLELKVNLHLDHHLLSPFDSVIMIRVLECLAILSLVWSSAMAEVSCPVVVQDLGPCLPFLRDNRTAKPSKICCRGVNDENDRYKTKKDRMEVCECLKTVLKNIDYDPKRIPLLGKACGNINLPPIDQKTNCSKVA